MNLIIVLIALAMIIFWPEGSKFKTFHWLEKYFQKINSLLPKQWMGKAEIKYVALLIPLLIVTGLIFLVFNSFSLTLPLFLFSGAMLWYSFNTFPLERDYEEYLNNLESRDESFIQEIIKKFLPENSSQTLVQSTHQMTSNMFIKANENIFSVIFWFFVFGPVGAFFYRLVLETQKLNESDISSISKKIQCVLDFIPARLLSLSFSLMGHFIAVMGCLKNYLKFNLCQNETLLKESGLAAIGVEVNENTPISMEEHQEAIYLIHRALITWLVVISLMVIVRWLSLESLSHFSLF